MSYDVKCYELAEAFLEDYLAGKVTRERATERLAQVIQDTIEDELGAMVETRLIREKP